ncbi:MAG: hypothetical protein BKP49_11250 [Treponema sp. CETP13]|nr:MAG: hypothetical protein BKP49_11250 [Treponema sp. CETP13]
MKEVIKRTQEVSILILILSIVFILLGIYLPMRNIILRNNIANFNNAATNITQIFKNEIEKNIQGSKSLSSRSAIRDKIAEYEDNKITFNELAGFSKQKYKDGIDVLDNLLSAQRIINGKTLIHIINNNHDNFAVSNNLNSKTIIYTIYKNDSTYVLKVESPISTNKKIVGYDIVYFSLNKIIAELNTDSYSLTVITNGQPEEDTNYLYYNETLTNGTILSVKASKTTIFSKINEISLLVIIRIIIFIIIIAFIIYFFIIRFMNKKIKLLSQDRDIFKNKAILDELTGAYSRSYIHTFMKQNPRRSCSLAMLDLDNFKKVNDKYGHVYGDELLKTLVQCTKSILRSDDAIIRLGGDEFLLIFSGIKEIQTKAIIERIKNKIVETKIGQHIHFSFGISFVPNTDLLLDYIEQADARMYINKTSKKNNR